MHVSTLKNSKAKLHTLSLQDVSVTDGFWQRRQQINRKTSLRHGFKKLQDSGNFNNLKLAAGTGSGEYATPLFMDSDIYKWLEAVSYELANAPDDELDGMADEAIEYLVAAQMENGYLNSFYQVVEPDRHWKELSQGHELYCAGHMFEAAVAHHRATGKTSLLNVATKLADHIVDTFGPGKQEGTPGHPEIELAMIELYRETGKKEYLDMVEFFVHQRGTGTRYGRLYWFHFPDEYYQDRVPVKDADIIEGHAVRQLYLTAGITDLYLETGDPALKETLDRLWDDLVNTKMYITAGYGARHEGEAFGDAYELPSDRCYCETCASIAGIMWNWRMLLLTGEARYADLIERSLYNGFLSGVSLDGQRYFYVNPLQARRAIERPEWYGCACCPPNIMRLVALIGHYAATVTDTGLQVHQYISTDIAARIDKDVVKAAITTNYPADGKITITIEETGNQAWELALRIPAWCTRADIQINGQSIDSPALVEGYARLDRVWRKGDTIQLNLEMLPRLTAANPRVDSIRGSLAIELGPMVYCLEQVDQPDVNLLDVRIDPAQPLSHTWQADLLNGVNIIEAKGTEVDVNAWGDALYRSGPIMPLPQQSINLTAIPYYAWANRQPGPMRVWIPQKSER